MLVIPQTTPATIKISEHFYKVIRLSLQGEYASIMDLYKKTHWGCGIEYYQQLKCIFHLLWPVSVNSTQIIAFYQLFHHPKTIVNIYTANVKQ